ncbi:MAG: VWA domain-containing protein [Candidatus Protochlamydia sp.]|nr:VWA domain-containing protein [Candidatus Protochlamydia sp.]
MFHFYCPWFALLIPLPFLIRRFFPRLNAPPAATELYFPSLHRLKKAFPIFQAKAVSDNRLFFFFLSFAWLFLVLALMQPEKVDQFKQVNNKGYDIMLAVDISASMQAADFSTSARRITRLDMTKEVVGKFALGRQGDRVGLVTFGESAYLHVPLTLDTVAVSRMLNDTVSGMAGNGTAIGDAIGLSVRTLRERPEGSRVLVLLTDGEDNASSIPPLEAARLAKQYGIRIYTVGVGTNYGMAQFPMDEGLLKEISALTGGHYFLAADGKGLKSIYEKIDQLEKTESKQAIILVREPFYFYPLGAALIFLGLLSFYQLLNRRAA